jgi:glutamate synthase domain-containing protein 2
MTRFLRYATFLAVALATPLLLLLLLVLVLVLVLWQEGRASGWWAVLTGALAALGLIDLVQTRHAVLRNYPALGHARFLFEMIRPEIRQYLIESDTDGVPFSRQQRAIVYQRAKQDLDKRPFGSQFDAYAIDYEWINHSIAPAMVPSHDFRVAIGGPACARPYDASVFNISAMSFGSPSANAIRALNEGARRGRFAHDTGEGSISAYHREHGGDLIWEIGSGYFGSRPWPSWWPQRV